jgi:hypothetical protein
MGSDLLRKADGKHGYPGINDFPSFENWPFPVIIRCKGRAEG